MELDISDNFFRGCVPQTLLNHLNPLSFIGNPGLCISSNELDGLSWNRSTSIKLCASHSSSRLSNVQVATMSLGSSLLIVLLLIGLVYMLVYSRRNKQNIATSAKVGTTSLLDKVMEATNNTDERFIIGRGAHGVVYKAALDSNTTFAVKKLTFAGLGGGSQSMVREIQTVERIRHRNLISLEDYWFGKDHGLLLYKYEPNGSLYDVLHEMNDSATALPWKSDII